MTSPFSTISRDVLRRQLSIVGYVKVGGFEKRKTPRWGRQGPYSLPQSYTDPARFEITTRNMEREKCRHPQRKTEHWWNKGYRRDKQIHGIIGDAPDRLNVRLMFDDPKPNFQHSLGWYDGRQWACRGDGEVAHQVVPDGSTVKRECPCERLNSGDSSIGICKPRGVLTVWLEDSGQYGTCHIFKTTSWQSISQLKTQLELFHAQFGELAWLPMVLRVDALDKTYADGDKRRRTRQPIVTLALRCGPREAALMAQEHEALRDRVRHSLLADPGEHIEALEEEMETEAVAEAQEFRPGTTNRPPPDDIPPRNASERLLQLRKD